MRGCSNGSVERIITSPQGSQVDTVDGPAVNFCANNYLGLANHPAIVEAAAQSLGERGFGLSSVRFICGTQDLHKELEARISEFLGTEDTLRRATTALSGIAGSHNAATRPVGARYSAVSADQRVGARYSSGLVRRHVGTR